MMRLLLCILTLWFFNLDVFPFCQAKHHPWHYHTTSQREGKPGRERAVQTTPYLRHFMTARCLMTAGWPLQWHCNLFHGISCSRCRCYNQSCLCPCLWTHAIKELLPLQGSFMLSPVSLCCLFVFLGGLSKRFAINYGLCWENPILTKISELNQMIYYGFSFSEVWCMLFDFGLIQRSAFSCMLL